MNEFSPPGKALPTHRNPNGVPVAAQLLPVIADLQAIRKVTGYMAVNATYFCNWCLLQLSDIERLDYSSWTLRKSDEVAAQAKAWFNATTVALKNQLSKISGVRWSPIQDIFQWDPVLHIVLGYMHNWLEGILMRHLRVYWGIDRPKKETTDAKNLGDPDDIEPDVTESGMSESASELEDLEKEAAHHTAQSSQEPAELTDDDMASDSESDSETTPTPDTFMGIGVDNEDDNDDEFLDFEVPGMFNFTPVQLGSIRNCIKRISLPTWVARPPTNLGDATHGKLKAHEYLILFTVILPLIIPELWWKKGNLVALLHNFHHLMACTNIVSSFSTSKVQADKYTDHYVKYREALPRLFPVNFHSVSNQHLAMHNAQQMKFWGPLPPLSEFAGERMNGMLQDVKTNRREDDMPLTMLRQMARRCCLEAKLRDSQSENGPASDLAKILQPNIAANIKAALPLSEAEVAKILSVLIDLDEDDYQMLLQYLTSQGQLWCDCYQLPHPAGSLVLPPCALKPNQFKFEDYDFSRYRSTRGNSGIQFKDPVNESLQTGFIDEIWQMPLQGHIQTFLVIQKHKLLSAALLEQTPYFVASYKE
ncbi:hypothetical protein C8R43DRAFT_908207 [Mycena crocata]|nr:hypothetical protein C8R43DRAFT_908207 [Mycena crocata]